MSDTPLGADGHAGDLVSALLDGELDEQTTEWVQAHLASCERCRAAADDAEAARSWLRAAPTVDASPVVESVIARRRRLVGTGLAFVGVAAVALAALALTSAVIHPTVVPDVDDLVATHESSAHERMEGVQSVEEAGGPYATPPGMEGTRVSLSRLAVFDGRDLTTVVYADRESEVSVFQQPGHVDWDGLPPGRADRIGGRTVWVRPGSPVVVVTEVGDLVVTVVADRDEAAHAVVAGLPEPTRSSTFDRVHDSCQRLIQVFALGE